ncbi:MAG: hypothetical protein ACI3XR_07130 [Eubacteriales bacterium]
MTELKHKKICLPDGAGAFPNLMSTVLIQDGIVYLFSDTILQECAEKIDALPARQAKEFALLLFGSAKTARMNKKGKVSLKEHPGIVTLLEKGFSICRLREGLYALVPSGTSLVPGKLFAEDVAKFGAESHDPRPEP